MITSADIDELLQFRATLCAPDFEPVLEWRGGKQPDGVIQLPYPIYHSSLDEFIRVASKDCWRDTNYLENFEPLQPQLPNLSHVGMSELQTILTYIVRGERFSNGHWAETIKSGLVCALFQRLEQLRSGV